LTPGRFKYPYLSVIELYKFVPGFVSIKVLCMRLRRLTAGCRQQQTDRAEFI